MIKLRLYMFYFINTLGINWLISLFFSIFFSGMSPDSIVYWFSFFSITLGFIASIIIKESSFFNKEECYFYYNFGISKVKLVIFCTVLNILLAVIIIIGYHFGKQYIIY